jgi:ABC-type branched-subunit amino acid transport system ATPase component
MTAIINVSQLTKTYASGFQALQRIDLDIRQGEIFALLGPNGAGKTTTMRVLTGFLPCGLVYGYLALASSSASIWAGLLTMSNFSFGREANHSVSNQSAIKSSFRTLEDSGSPQYISLSRRVRHLYEQTGAF